VLSDRKPEMGCAPSLGLTRRVRGSWPTESLMHRRSSSATKGRTCGAGHHQEIALRSIKSLRIPRTLLGGPPNLRVLRAPGLPQVHHEADLLTPRLLSPTAPVSEARECSSVIMPQPQSWDRCDDSGIIVIIIIGALNLRVWPAAGPPRSRSPHSPAPATRTPRQRDLGRARACQT
jgi:hypothetical protein